MGAACPLLAARFSLLDRPDILLAVGLLAGTLLIGAIVLAFVERWRKRAANETYSTHDQLAQFRLLYERGELSQQEYENIRRQLLARLKNEKPAADQPTPAAAPPSGEAAQPADTPSDRQDPLNPAPPPDGSING